MRLPETLQSPGRDYLLVLALLAILTSGALAGWGVVAYLLTGLIFAALFLASAVVNARQRRAAHR